MYLRTFEMCVLKYMNSTLLAPGLTRQVALKKAKVKLDLLTDINMLIVVEKGQTEVEYVMLFINM